MSIADSLMQTVRSYQAQVAQPARPYRTGSLSLSGQGVFEAAQARILGKMDTDGDGALSAQELSAGMPGGKAPGAVDPAVIAAFDKDADGKLRLDELQPSGMFSMDTLNALLGQQSDAAPAEPPKARFEASSIGAWLVKDGDQDGDGLLSASEFAAVGPTADGAATRAFTEADADKNGKVSGEELAAQMENGPHRLYLDANVSGTAPSLVGLADSDGDAALSMDEVKGVARSPDGLTDLFSEADANGDGKLTADEIATKMAAQPDYYGKGMSSLADMPSQGSMALMRLLRTNLDQLTARYTAPLLPQGLDTRA